MKPFTRLSLIILTASLLPCLAVIYQGQRQRSNEASATALRLAVLSDIKHESAYEGEAWLKAHANHDLAPLVSRIYHPDMREQLAGRVGKKELLQALQVSQFPPQLTPEQMREAVMHGSVDADDERQRRRWKKEDQLAKFRAQPVSPPASVDDAVQRALRMAAGQAP